VPAALVPFGDAAVRIAVPRATRAGPLLESLRAVPGVVDAVIAEGHAVVTFEPGRPPAGIDAALERASSSARPLSGKEHRVAVVYDGPDVAEVAARAGLQASDVAALHAAGSYEVSAVGFLPGFAYLRGLDARLVGPRRTSPRPRVPAGAVAIAGPYSGVYPFASPGGWQLIGTAVGFVPFTESAGATLALGDRVRFVEVSR
jgi:UPF0271 protein